MRSIAILSSEASLRRELALLAGETGYLAHPAGALEEALEILRERRPSLMLVADAPGQDAAAAIREIAAVSPLIPVVVALRRRDAQRAVCLMRLGACDVVAPPWTKADVSSCLARTLRTYGTAFSVVPLKAVPRMPVFLLSVGLFFALCLGYLSVQRQAAVRDAALQVRVRWDLPYRHPAAASFGGADLWVFDWLTQSVYVHAAPGMDVRQAFRFPGEPPISLAVGPDAIWCVTPAGTVTRRMRDPSLRLLSEFPGAAPDAIAIVFDGLYVWTASAKTRTLRKHLNDDRLTLLGTWPYPGARPAALVFDGGSLWSLDAGNRELLQHNLERPDETVRRVALSEYRDGLYEPVGLAWDGDRFFTVAGSLPPGKTQARLFQHPAAQPR